MITRIVSRIITYVQAVCISSKTITAQSLEVLAICFFQFDFILLDRRSVEINPHFPSCCGLIQVQNNKRFLPALMPKLAKTKTALAVCLTLIKFLQDVMCAI